MNYNANQNYYQTTYYSQNSPGLSSNRGTVSSTDFYRSSSKALSSYHDQAKQPGLSYTVYNPSASQGDNAARKKLPLHVQTNRRYSKDSEFLAKAAEVLERSGKLASESDFEPSSQNRPVHTPNTTYTTYTAYTENRAKNPSSKNDDILSRANEILKRSAAISQQGLQIQGTRDYSGVNNLKNITTTSRTPQTVQTNQYGETPLSVYQNGSFADRLTPKLPGEDTRRHANNFLSKVDEALQKSLQITANPNLSQITKTEPVSRADQSYHQQDKQRTRDKDRDIKPETSRSNYVARETKESNMLNPALHEAYNEVVKRSHDVLRREEEGKRTPNIRKEKEVSQNASQISEKPPLKENIDRGSVPKEKSPPKVYMEITKKKPKFAEEFYEDGSTYKGEKIKDWKHGRGELVCADKSKYEGEWEKDRRRGYGILTFPSENIQYDGEWKDDVYHGNGILMNDNAQQQRGFDYRNFDTVGNGWIKYEGEFVEGKKQGMGTLTLVNNERYVGKFKFDKVHGTGVFHTSSGETVSGEWENNKFVRIL